MPAPPCLVLMAPPEKLRYDRVGGPETAKIGNGPVCNELAAASGRHRQARRVASHRLCLARVVAAARCSDAARSRPRSRRSIHRDRQGRRDRRDRGQGARGSPPRRSATRARRHRHRLSGGGAAAKLAKLDDKTITDLVASFEVANERMSAVRYLGDYTFHFRAEPVQRVFRTAGIALSGDPARKAARKSARIPAPRWCCFRCISRQARRCCGRP